MRARLRHALALLAFACSVPADAYQVETHRRMSIEAIPLSTLGQRVLPLGRDLRLIDSSSFLSDGGLYLFGLTAFESGRSVGGWVGEGAVKEDDTVAVPPGRWIFHFYNPNAPLGQRGFAGAFRDSLDWGVEAGRATPMQEFSLLSAKGYFYQSLTAPTQRERKRNLSLLYRSLGQVIHLVQDLAQPQHTRNDSHGIQHYYEAYTSRVLGQLSFGGYSPVKVTTPDQFWTTSDGKGLADYSNRNFVTAGTNFRGTMSGNQLIVTPDPRFPAPVAVGDPLKLQITDLLGPPDPNQPLTGQIWFVQSDVTDNNVPGTVRNPRASSFSLFSEDLRSLGFQMEFALNRFNYDVAHGFLIPRAVGYSAGLLDYFFRGKLEISEPDDVVYSLVDPMQNSSFARIKFKVRNNSGQEGMTNGTLWAVAKFNRNTCYQPNLSGEHGGPNAPNIVQCRTADNNAQVAVSQPISSFSLGANEQRALSFDFSQNPIPVNATDLYLQVVYRGPLGSEQDGVAFGFKDLFEPAHLAYFNATDVTEINDRFYTFDQVLAGIIAGDQTFAKIDLNQNKIYGAGDYFVTPFDFLTVNVSFVAPGQRIVATIPNLGKGRYSRLAALTDRRDLPFFPSSFGFLTQAPVNQVNEEGTTFFVASVAKLRENWVTNASVIRYCVPGTTCNGNLRDMPESKEPSAAAPVLVNVTIQYP